MHKDTNKINLLVKLMNAHRPYKPEEALKYEKSALELAEKLKWGIFSVKSVLGSIYWRLNNYNQALKFHLAPSEISENSGNKSQMIDSYLRIAHDYADYTNYPEDIIE